MKVMFRSLLWLVVALPALVTLWMSREAAFNAQEWDAWAITGKPLRAWTEGRLNWAMLREQIVDTRMLVPRLIHLGLARITAWDARWETLIAWFLAAGAFSLLARQILRTFSGQFWHAWGLSLAAAALFFTPLAFPQWIYAPYLMFSLVALMLSTQVALFSTDLSLGKKVLLASLAAWVASESFINGFLAWGLLLWLILGEAATGRITGKTLAKWLGLWALLVAVVLATYLPGFKIRSHGAAEPLATGRFFLEWLGAPFVRWKYGLKDREVLEMSHQWAPWLGLTGVLVASGLIFTLVKRHRHHEILRAAWPWIGLGGYGLLSGAMITVGRVAIDPSASFWHRYIGFATWFWLPCLVLMALCWRRAVWLSLVLVWPFAVGWRYGRDEFILDRLKSPTYRAALQFISVAPEPHLLHIQMPGSSKMLANYVPALAEKGYYGPGVMKSDKVSEARIAKDQPATGEIKSGSAKSENALLEGWALAPGSENSHPRAADAIAISAQPEGGEEIWIGLATDWPKRTKEGKRYGLSGEKSRIGWIYEKEVIPPKNGWAGPEGATPPPPPRKALPSGKLTYRAYVMDTDSLTFYPLKGEVVK